MEAISECTKKKALFVRSVSQQIPNEKTAEILSEDRESWIQRTALGPKLESPLEIAMHMSRKNNLANRESAVRSCQLEKMGRGGRID